VTVLIADFANHTDDAVFSSGTLESVLNISLEESPFIASYSRDAAHKAARLLGGSVLTEELAHTIAVREGIEYVVAGSLDRQDGRYLENVSVSDAEGMAPPNAHRVTASSREQVLTTVAEIAHDIRRDLGEKKPPRQRPETFTSSSLDAIHAYQVAQELTLNGKANDAIAEYNHAILLDPNLGRAYSGLAVIYRNKYQIDEALKYFDQALKHVDHMTDREKFRTRGNYYATLGVPDKAIYEYSQLVKQYPADNAGWANLALVWAVQRDMAKAVEYGREPLKIYPKNVAQRSNLAWYLLYDGQYGEAITQAKQALEFNRAYVKAYVVMALAQLAQGNVTDAEKTYNDLRLVSADGASTAALGLADVALYQGRMEEASNLLENGANSDLATHNALGAARKLAILAQADLAMGKVAEASTAAARCDSAQSKEDGVMFQLAQVFVQLNPARASEIASQMGESLNRDRRCYALLLSGELSLQQGETDNAIVHFEDALRLVDAWLVRYDLGLAYLKAKRYAEADDELESCLRRRGEAASAFIDDTPTYRVVPAIYYYHGLAEDGVGVASAKQWYQDFLDIKTGGGPDQMIDKARQRVRTAGDGGVDHAADGREGQPPGPKEKSLLAPARSRSHPKK
jgi:tetratricopeptide (TPR) repeat protein